MPTTATTARANVREHILDVALQLMSEHGSAAVSMRQLAQACGVQVAAIYHYFPSKEDLLAKVVEERRYTSRSFDLPEGLEQAPVAERLLAVFELFWNGALDEEPVLRLLLGEAIRGQAVALPMGETLLQVFHDGVVTAIKGLIPEIDEPEVAAQAVVAHVFSGFIRHIFEPLTPSDELGSAHGRMLVRTLGV